MDDFLGFGAAGESDCDVLATFSCADETVCDFEVVDDLAFVVVRSSSAEYMMKKHCAEPWCTFSSHLALTD